MSTPREHTTPPRPYGRLPMAFMHEANDDLDLRHRAEPHVGAAIRALLHGRADEATIQNATSIVLRGLTPSALSRIASAGSVTGTDLVQSLIPNPQSRTPVAFNWSAISPAEIARLHAAGLLGDYDYQRALAMRGGGDMVADAGSIGTSSDRYGAIATDISRIRESNYAGSHYQRAGVDYHTFNSLRAEGFSGQNILNAANDARALGFRANDQAAMRDHALIDRHSIDAPGMNAALRDYRRRTHEDAELGSLIDQRRRATTDAERSRLDALIAARRLDHARASGLHDRLNNPNEDRRAREGGGRRRDALDRLHEEDRRLAPDHSLNDAERLERRTRSGDQTELDRIALGDVRRDRVRPNAVAIAQADDAFGPVAPPSPPAPLPPASPPAATVAPSPAGQPSPASPGPAVIHRAAAPTPSAASAQAATLQPNAPKLA